MTIWHCIFSAELTKNALFQTVILAILPTGKRRRCLIQNITVTRFKSVFKIKNFSL